MNTFIPSKEELEEIVSRTVQYTMNKVLPDAIRKASRKKWLTTDQAMEVLQCSRRHIQYLRDEGKLPYRQHKRTIRYDIDELEAFLNKGKVNKNSLNT